MVPKFKDRKGTLIIKPNGREVLDRTSAYGIAKHGNKVYLVRPGWSDEFELPGGGIEKEEVINGLKREFLEETGFSINVTSNLPIKSKSELFYADDIDTFFNSKLLFFRVEVVGKRNPLSINKEEIKESGWYILDDNKKIRRSHLDVLRDVFLKGGEDK